jgi:nucleoside-diphosphate-sugar epimerase
MKIFITGASGFIGSHLVPLLSNNHDVYCMTSDLMDFAAVEAELIDQAPDVVVHLAARTEVERSFYEQTDFSQVNYVGSVNLIEAAAKVNRLKNFVFASTMEVYGWQPISDEVKQHGKVAHPVAFDETTEPHPNAPYAVAKLAVEKYLEYMHRAVGLPFTAIRQTNSYGRRDNDFFVTEQIITQMLKNPKDCFLGYKTPYRNFIFINDLLDAWVRVIESPELVKDGEILTLGPDNPVRIDQYAQMIADKLNWKGTIHWDSKPHRPGEIYWLNSNNNLIYKLLGWQPQVSLDQGLDRTIDIWRKQLDKK